MQLYNYGTSSAAMTILYSNNNVGIGTSSPNSLLQLTGNNATVYDASVDSGQDDGGVTLTIRNNDISTVGSFSQIDMMVSGDSGRAVGRIVTIRTASATSDMAFVTENANTKAERMRITSGGGVGIGTTSVTGTTKLSVLSTGAVNGNPLCFIDNGVYNAFGLYSAGADGYNGLVTVLIMGKNTTTNRSINAGGSINGTGNDYAEYMTKAIEDNIAKGDIVGINQNGLLTNVFMDAKSFVVKSTDPSYVGGDTWGNVDDIGKLPLEATEEEKAEYNNKLEAARAKVDRIAFSGQVPCNVYDANVGDYIIPIDDNGIIKGQAITNPTFEQYQISVGKVWKIMEDGRAWIAVKIG